MPVLLALLGARMSGIMMWLIWTPPESLRRARKVPEVCVFLGIFLLYQRLMAFVRDFPEGSIWGNGMAVIRHYLDQKARDKKARAARLRGYSPA